MVIQTLGVVTTFIVFAQLAIAGAMPLPYFTATSVVVASGLVINFMNYFNVLPVQILKFWEDFITVGGFSVLPQVISLLAPDSFKEQLTPNTKIVSLEFWFCKFFLQVMWSTFVPFVPNSILPGLTALVTALLAVALVGFLLPMFYISRPFSNLFDEIFWHKIFEGYFVISVLCERSCARVSYLIRQTIQVSQQLIKLNLKI